MKASDDLFQLVSSLSSNEKSYFKKFVSKGKTGNDNNYMQLFDAIDKQTHKTDQQYNEQAIREIFAGKAFAKQLSRAKNYLYIVILQSLRAYHSNNSINARIKALLLEVEILHDKGLYKLCRKVLAKAKKLAVKYENHLYLFEILGWELEILFRKLKGVSTKKDLLKILEEERVCLDVIKNLSEYRKIDYLIFAQHMETPIIRDEADLTKYKAIISNPLMKNEKNALAFEAKLYFYRAKGGYFLTIGNYKKGYEYLKEFVELIESDSQLINEKPYRYIAAVHNFIIAALCYKRYEESLHYIEKITRRVQKDPAFAKHENIQILIFQLHCEKVTIYNETGQFDKGIALISTLEKGLQYFKGQLSSHVRLSLYFQFSSLYFGINDYSKSLEWLNKLLNDQEIHSMRDLDYFTRLMELILLFELGDYDVMEYKVRSTYRFLYKKKQIYKLEECILNFIRKNLPKINILVKGEMITALKELRKELIEIAKNPFEQIASLEYFDFISWLDSKIQVRPFADIVIEKARKKEKTT